MVKIFFDNVNFESRTGPNSFARRLANEFFKSGHEITGHDECDVHLSFIEQVFPKAPNSVLVQRLDGIWFKPEDFHTKNTGIKKTYDSSDGVIWQTEFDKQMITKFWGSKNGKVIGNGMLKCKTAVVNEWLANVRKSYSKVFCCSANWHRQKRLKENTLLALQLFDQNPNSCLLVCGSNPDYVIAHPSIFYLGDLPHEILMQVYEISDWMIHLAWLDHFPNTVVESIMHNTPVIHSDSGGTKEVVLGSGLTIKEKDQFEFSLCDYEKPPDLEISSFRLADVQVSNEHLNIEIVARQYIDFFENLLRTK